MKFKHKILAVIAAAGMAGATASHAATVNISTEAGQSFRTLHGIRDDTATRGIDLLGMVITVNYVNGLSEDLTWGMIGRSTGIIGTDMMLTFRGRNWDLTSSALISSLSMDVRNVDSMFDIASPASGADTETTLRGFGFEFREPYTEPGEVNVTYSNQIRYRNDDFVGDAFTAMSVDFTGLFGGGFSGVMAFSTDLDTLRYAGDLAPVPVPGGLPLLASGALLLGLVRRKMR